MARRPRFSLLDIPLHVVQRGNNRQPCFLTESDYAAYAHWLKESASKYDVAVHAWVFMTNHVHLLVTPKTADGVSKMMQTLGRYYVRYFNHRHQRTGSLWEGRFRSCVIDNDAYFMTCQRYIEMNPVRAGMVVSPEEYRWSSYRAHGMGSPVAMWSPHDLYQQLGSTPAARIEAYRELVRGNLDDAELRQLRSATNAGGVLGSLGSEYLL